MNSFSFIGGQVAPEPISLFPCGGGNALSPAKKELAHLSSVGSSAESTSSASNPEAKKTTKTVYLIRHAESHENRRLASFSRSISRLGKFTLPNRDDVAASVELLDVKGQVDSDVSDIGQRQIEHVAAKLRRDNFLVAKNIEVVAHSPLKRARQTSEGVLGCVSPKILTPSSVDDAPCVQTPLQRACQRSRLPILGEDDPFYLPGKRAPSVKRVVELNCLSERTPLEIVHQGGFAQRILAFERWLEEQEEERIAVVGHSLYFKTMLGMQYKFKNCDVWELQFTPRTHSLIDACLDNEEEEDRHALEEELIAQSNSSESMEMPTASQSEDDVVLRHGWTGLTNLYRCDDELHPNCNIVHPIAKEP